MTDEFDNAEFAENHAANTLRELALSSPQLGQAVNDNARDIRAAIADAVAIPRKLEADIAELNKKRDLLPVAGAKRLRGELIAGAVARGKEVDRTIATTIEATRENLVTGALPRVAQDREALARDELRVAFGNSTGDAAAATAIALAQSGNREIVAALSTSFGRTLLESRGLAGRDLAETFATMRKVAAASALKHSTDVGEVLAAKALQKLDALGAARGAAGMALHRAIEKARR
jgi:hypothetical protein